MTPSKEARSCSWTDRGWTRTPPSRDRLRSRTRTLVGHLGVLDERGKPVVIGEKPAAEGLRFLGYLIRPSFIGYIGKLSRRTAKRIAKELSAG